MNMNMNPGSSRRWRSDSGFLHSRESAADQTAPGDARIIVAPSRLERHNLV